MKPTSPRKVLLPIVSLVVFSLLTWPVWRWLWGEWLGNDYYSHGLLIAPVSLFLAVQRYRHDEGRTWQLFEGSSRGLWLLVPSLLLYLTFLNDKAYYLASFAMIALIGALVWALGGDRTARKLLFPIAYLGFMVPLPFIERATLPLALFTGVCSSGLVQFLGLDIVIVGNAVTLPNANLVIGAQCSGINSLIALMALTTLLAYLLEGPLWGRIILVLLSIPLALLGNIVRVASLLFVARTYGAEAGFTFYHDYSGPVFFVVMLLLLIPLAWALRCRQLRPEVI